MVLCPGERERERERERQTEGGRERELVRTSITGDPGRCPGVHRDDVRMMYTNLDAFILREHGRTEEAELTPEMKQALQEFAHQALKQREHEPEERVY